MVVTTRSDSQLRARFFAHASRKKKAGPKKMSIVHRRIAMAVRARERGNYINRLLNLNEQETRNMVHLSSRQLDHLCTLLQRYAGLQSSPYVDFREKVYMFLVVLAHGATHSILEFAFQRSGSTVVRSLNEVLDCVVSMRELMLARLDPVTSVNTNEPWCHFQGCVGVVDGMRTGPNDYLLAACGKDMRFTYVNTKLDGSRCPMFVFKQALEADNLLHPDPGTYYLVSNQFANVPGFLAPYHKANCRLERNGPLDMELKEYFNEKHSQASTTMTRAFGLLKRRFAILRNGGLGNYTHDSQLKIVVACCLIHNLVHEIDPLTSWDISGQEELQTCTDPVTEVPCYETPTRDGFPGTNEWRNYRDSVTKTIYRRWLRSLGLPEHFEL